MSKGRRFAVIALVILAIIVLFLAIVASVVCFAYGVTHLAIGVLANDWVLSGMSAAVCVASSVPITEFVTFIVRNSK